MSDAKYRMDTRPCKLNEMNNVYVVMVLLK